MRQPESEVQRPDVSQAPADHVGVRVVPAVVADRPALSLQPRLDKFVLLRLKAYNSSLEAAIGTCRTIFGFLRFSAFI